MKSFDFVIIGSGFGGSVAAMRLAQKGYSVAVLESGKRWMAQDFPKTNWNLPKFFWAPLIRCFGIQNITLLKGVMVLHGAGVGGGSLVYANTLMSPREKVFQDSNWPKGVQWADELAPHYQMARKMLGVTTNTAIEEGELALQKIGKRLGVGETFHPTEVGVYFGTPEREVDDPFFSGMGPKRTGCNLCGGCMVGCRFGAKNTLDRNYLFFAEKWGTQIFSETQATVVRPVEGGYEIETNKVTSWLPQKGPTFRASKVIFSAGVLGTLDLLFKNRDLHKTLPNISRSLGDHVRTNGESLLGATSFEAHRNLSKGIAIGAAIHPDADTKIEGVRYSPGSDAMRFLAVPLTGQGNFITRPLKMLGRLVLRLGKFVRLMLVRDWARQTLILLVMQSVDQTMKLRLGRSILKGFGYAVKGQATDKPIPCYLPKAQEAAELLAEEINGEPQNVISEVLLQTPATAHILGGCNMGNSPKEGVIDYNHQIFGHPGLFVSDGSVIPVNLGVNPSLTITALAERFAGHFPLKEGFTEAQYRGREIKFTPSGAT